MRGGYALPSSSPLLLPPSTISSLPTFHLKENPSSTRFLLFLCALLFRCAVEVRINFRAMFYNVGSDSDELDYNPLFLQGSGFLCKSTGQLDQRVRGGTSTRMFLFRMECNPCLNLLRPPFRIVHLQVMLDQVQFQVRLSLYWNLLRGMWLYSLTLRSVSLQPLFEFTVAPFLDRSSSRDVGPSSFSSEVEPLLHLWHVTLRFTGLLAPFPIQG